MSEMKRSNPTTQPQAPADPCSTTYPPRIWSGQSERPQRARPSLPLGHPAPNRGVRSETAGPPSAAKPEGLTDREAEVLRHLARGTSNAEIADTLFLTESTRQDPRHPTSSTRNTRYATACRCQRSILASKRDWRGPATPLPDTAIASRRLSRHS
jgi:hypothetical protein